MAGPLYILKLTEYSYQSDDMASHRREDVNWEGL